MKNAYFRILLAVSALALAIVGYAAFLKTEEEGQPPPFSTEGPRPADGGSDAPPVQSASAPEIVRTGRLNVRWSPPVSIAPIDVFSDTYKGKGEYEDAYAQKNYANPNNYHRVGTVIDGAYVGGAVVFVNVASMNMGDPTYYHFIAPKSGKPVLLAKHSPEADAVPSEYQPSPRFDARAFIIDTTAEASELILPTAIARNDATLAMQTLGAFAGDMQKEAPLFDAKDKKKAFTHPDVGTVYTDVPGTPGDRAGFYAVAPDGTVRAYALVIPFMDADRLNVPQVTWDDGSKNSEEYWSTDVGGCGMRNYTSVVREIDDSELDVAGKTAQGENVYRLKDANHPLLKDVYENSYSLGRGKDKMSYEAFAASGPLFFWKDPFGRLVKFQKAAFLPAVECGKPVIYLYPEETTDVSVKLFPQGGFSMTEPAYDGGWNVRATPKGELTNLKDGKTHPYLFWEGRGGLYETPKQGFVVAQKDVHDFLVEKLSALGLNVQERADFIEFWEPRMTGSPYYFVTFLGNRAMDELAPLEVSPKPDTVIRVLMDYLPLEKPINVQDFTIRTPERKGFTVVEWGGVLR